MPDFARFWRSDYSSHLQGTASIQIPRVWFAFSILILLIALGALLLTGGYHAAFAPINALGKTLNPWFWQNLSALGDGRVLVLLALLLAPRRPELFWAMVLVALLTLLVSQGLKPLIGALRPPSVLESGSFVLMGKALLVRSFPSGHSLSIAAFVGVLWALWPAARGQLWRCLLLLLALAVGLSRVAVGAHWPVDVVTGLAMGLALAWLALLAASRWRWGMSPLVQGLGILLCLGNSYSLLYDHGGYPETLVLGQALTLLVWALLIRDLVWRFYLVWRSQGQGQHQNRHWSQDAGAAVRPAWRLLRWDLGLFVLLLGIFLIWPRLDIQVTAWFHQADSGFFLADNPLVRLSYRLFAKLHFLVLGLLLGLLIWQRVRGLSRRGTWFLLLALLLGPGLLVNLVFKEESGRARPRDIVEFGGHKSFTGAFIKTDQCATNCSFVSGHAAMGFYLLTLAWVLRRRYWLWLGLALGSLVGLGRLLQGGHFLSDVIFAFWAVYFVSLLLARWFYPPDERLQS
jgi:lipid A 4'-phosphatase